jgi:hypothetical protein
MVIFRYLSFGRLHWDRRQHLIAEDNQPICGQHEITAEMVTDKKVFIKAEPDMWFTVCRKCTQAKAGYLERRKLEEWNKAAK